MEIHLGNFLIEGSPIIGRFTKFNLYKLHTIESGKLEGKVLRRAEWYDATLEQCLTTIAQNRLNESKDEVDIQTYLDRYQDITNQLKKDAKTVNEALSKIIKQNEK